MSTFEETMENSRIFLTYSLAMTMLGKSAQILAERGADPKAMSFVTTGIELLAKQLRDYADGKDLEEGAEKELDSLCKMLDIQRANGGAAPSA
ncbi:MAG: hypothetical protein KDB65_13020 [Calditrichaeota bacterium]|nr:hypothetical protein [Calditrichota bacterium]MCB9368617.1 hypothetical protein [Calditrichota bacterium]